MKSIQEDTTYRLLDEQSQNSFAVKVQHHTSEQASEKNRWGAAPWARDHCLFLRPHADSRDFRGACHVKTFYFLREIPTEYNFRHLFVEFLQPKSSLFFPDTIWFCCLLLIRQYLIWKSRVCDVSEGEG